MSQINLVGQKKLIHDLEKKINSGRLAHSYLLFGPSGSGKLSVAIKFAELILCSKYKDRELEVIQKVVEGKQSKEIAAMFSFMFESNL